MKLFRYKPKESYIVSAAWCVYVRRLSPVSAALCEEKEAKLSPCVYAVLVV